MPLLYPCDHEAHLPAWEAATVPAPIVVTLAVDEATQAAWDRMRRQWFPSERLVVGAHVTLFHALPGGRLDALLLDVAEVAATTGPFPLAITAVRPLGRGVALRVGSAILDRLHADLADRWRPWLTPQDAARFSAHVTIQNKVSPEVARATLADVAGDFTPYEALATGLATWRYVGGPWEPVLVTPFASPGSSPVLRATPRVPGPGLSGDQDGPRSPASAGRLSYPTFVHELVGGPLRLWPCRSALAAYRWPDRARL